MSAFEVRYTIAAVSKITPEHARTRAPMVFGLVSALPGAKLDESLPADGLIQVGRPPLSHLSIVLNERFEEDGSVVFDATALCLSGA